MENRSDLQIKWVSSHCGCIIRFPNRRFVLSGKSSVVSFPYFVFPSSKFSFLNFISQIIPLRTLDFFRGFAFLRATRDCDIVHFQQSSFFSFGLFSLVPIILFSRQRKIVTLHSLDHALKLKPLYRLYNHIDRIIVHSEHLKIHLIKMGVRKSKIMKIPHGVNVPPLYGFKRSEITFMGAPEKRKGILVIMDALKILKSRKIDVKVSIYGFYSDLERKSTELEARARDVNDLLIWGGQLNENEFDSKLQQSLFTFAMYDSATSGSSIVTRAMSNATTVLASDIGGFREYLIGSGVLIPPNDPEALAEAIQCMLKNPEMLEKMGLEGRRRATKILSWKEIANSTAAMYENLI
jgi:glycosyltransferase involved in cell wall biosynthesis